MSGPSTYQPKSGLERWLDARLPIIRFAQEHLSSYPTPRNLNVWYVFGAGGVMLFKARTLRECKEYCETHYAHGCAAH